MKIAVKDGDTFTSLAVEYTIGGKEYGVALAAHNGWEQGSIGTLDGLDFAVIANETPLNILLDEVDIPDDWLKAPADKKSLMPVFLIAGAVLVFSVLDVKRLFR